jgi:diaminopimelate decarboxylase
MDSFAYVDEELCCEEVPLSRIAAEVGTPVYVYSYETLEQHFRAFDEAFSAIPHLVCFSAKSNANLAILRLFGKLGGGADIVSGGELYRALQAGIPANRVVFSGVGKTDREIDEALQAGILMFNVESTQELEVVNERAGAINGKAPIALRVNPDVDPQTHPYISTGLKSNKFGIDIDKAVQNYRQAAQLPNIEVLGVDCHIGSQITQVEPFVDALRRAKGLVLRLREEGIQVQYLDVGGGLGITYKDEKPPAIAEYARAVMDETHDVGCKLILEPGRVIVGNAGVLLSRVLYTKEGETKRFVIVDAGMNDMMRPSLYGSYHRIQAVHRWLEEQQETIDLVGPICESADFFVKDRRLPRFQRDDLVAVMSAGAYGFSMSSNYNARPRAAEVLVQGERYAVIRRREAYTDLVMGEAVPAWI